MYGDILYKISKKEEFSIFLQKKLDFLKGFVYNSRPFKWHWLLNDGAGVAQLARAADL